MQGIDPHFLIKDPHTGCGFLGIYQQRFSPRLSSVFLASRSLPLLQVS